MPEPRGEARSGFLNGDRIYLRAVEPDDLPVFMRIANDPEMRGLTGCTEPMSRADAEQWLERVRADRDRLWLSIVLRDGDRVIGEAGLLRVFHPWRRADMTVMIGDRSAWGKGLGSEAARLLIDHAFGAMSLHRLAVGVVGFNTRAIRFWESLGFQREGVERDGYFYGGRFHDFVMMSLLDDDHRPAPRGAGRI